jgi:aminoglycoside phosphotransferase (APT) family kinase protein
MTMADRQAIFGGTEAPPAHLALDPDVLRRFLSPRLPGLDGPIEAVKFKGGQSNPTYRLEGPGACYVLRRKPPGTLVATAHQIDREYRVIAALHGAGVPVPKPWFYCADESVIGSEFYIAECVEGRVFWEAEAPGVSPADRTAIYDEMNAVLARIHSLDVDAIGLGDLGRRDGYTARNLARWSGSYQKAALVPIPDMDWLIAELSRRLPAETRSTFIHGDYGLYNLIVHPTELHILAVLDWEMATIGDPLVDLAHHVRPWWDIPDPNGSATSIRALDLEALGIPGMEAYFQAYARHRGVSLPDMRFYLAFAQFRYAAMVQGILKRAADGTASSRVMLHRQERVFEIAKLARTTLDGSRKA